MKKLALAVSFASEPFLVSLFTLFVTVLVIPVEDISKLIWFLTALLLCGVPPLSVYLYERKTGKIHDFFMTKRVERRDVQIAWFVGSGLFFLTALFFEAPRLLLALSLTFVWLSLISTLVSLYWKMSIHMVATTLFVMVLLLAYSANFSWFLLLLPIVAWARLKLGHHTLTQVTLATLVTISVTYFVFSLFDVATF